MPDSIYLDFAASTPLDSRVKLAMEATLGLPGNPSSIHGPGRVLRSAIDRARASVARLLGVPEEEIIFTSGATEANTLALQGVIRAVKKSHPDKPVSIAISGIEHASLMECARLMEVDGEVSINIILADKNGIVTADAVVDAIKENTVIVAVMWANNVLGTIQPVAEIGRLVEAERARRNAGGLPIVFVCDAVQAIRTEAVHPTEVGADLLTLSAHKIYGPKGVGALRIAGSAPFLPPVGGGGQEGGRRHGTENAAGIAGFGVAADILLVEREAERTRTANLKQNFIDKLRKQIPSVRLVPETSEIFASLLPGIVFIRLPKISGDEAVLRLDVAGFAVSAGSACDTGARRSPRVLAQVLDEQAALRGGIRVSFGRSTTDENLEMLTEELVKI